MVHFMSEEAREQYELEQLWTVGPRYDNQCREMAEILAKMEDEN